MCSERGRNALRSPEWARMIRERVCLPWVCLLEQHWEQEDQELHSPSTQSSGHGISHGFRSGGGSPGHRSAGTTSAVGWESITMLCLTCLILAFFLLLQIFFRVWTEDFSSAGISYGFGKHILCKQQQRTHFFFFCTNFIHAQEARSIPHILTHRNKSQRWISLLFTFSTCSLKPTQ